MYTRNPTAVPVSESRPAIRPWLMLRETRYTMFGPGVSTMPNAVNAMPAAAVAEITTPTPWPVGPFPVHSHLRTTGLPRFVWRSSRAGAGGQAGAIRRLKWRRIFGASTIR
ncbi:hypothetical protein GCM10023192_06670 [Amycolatopsis samaneae]